MNAIEKKMVEILKHLRANYGATAIKINLEAEGIRLDEIQRTKEIVMSSGVGLTVKIGGCEALTDLRISKMVGVNSIMAPMIESRFALEKYLDMVENEYQSEELADLDLLINIETVDGFEKIDQILSATNVVRLNGIVLGRTDLTSAVNAKDVDALEILSIAKDVFLKAKALQLKCIVGGGTTVKSIPFYKQLDGLIDGFETRKVVFADYGKVKPNIEQGILMALEFEYHWYEAKQQHYGKIYNEDAGKMKKIAAMLGLK